jgi:Spy/CpxP family protein refolding chaperone
MVKHFAVEIDANDAQRDKLVTIAKAAAAELAPMREKMRAARGQGIKILGAPAVDRAALEALRAEQVANGEAMSKRMTQLMADAAEVLTPEQRQKLAERMEKRRERWGRGHHGDKGPRGDKGDSK